MKKDLEMKKFYVYVHTCPNGKRYVGATTASKPERRWLKGRGYRRQLFEEAILKYGWDNITHEVFEVDSAEEMYRKEVELISFYHSNDPNFGYNTSLGGKYGHLGCKHSEETRKKMSQSMKGKHHKPFSAETKRRMSETAKERWLDPEVRRKRSEAIKENHSDPEFRKKLSEVCKKGWSDPEIRRKRSESMKGKSFSEEHKKHLSESLKGRPKPKVKIKLPDGTLVEITKNLLARNYINKGRKFEYVS